MDKTFATVAGKVLTGLLAGMALSAAATAQEPRIGTTARQQIETLMQEKASRTAAQRRISSDLLFEARRQRGEAIVQGLSSVRSSVRTDRSGRVVVDIKAEVTDGLLRRIENLGGRVVSAHEGYGAVRAAVPLMQLEALAQSPQVRFIRTASLPIASMLNTSEGDITHMVDLGRADFGVDGTGTKICVLSDSVDSLATVQASGDLPASIDILPGQDGVDLGAGEGVPETIGEGTATLEIIHDLAPGASLGFATGWLNQESFAQNIRDLRTSGCDVLVDNVIHITEPVFQDGEIAKAVDDVVADGAVYFSAAGNFGNLNDGTSGVWEGDFLATAIPIGSLNPDYEFAHDFGGGESMNTITADSPYGYALQWSDPQGASTNDYDLYLISEDRSSVVGFSSNDQVTTPGDPFEGIDSRVDDDTGKHLLIVRKTGGGDDRYLHVNAFGGQLAFATAGQTWGHSAARGAFSIAAVNWGSVTPAPFTGAESVETYSSDGPRRVFYEWDGTPITPGDVSSTGGELRQKPDLAAADNVSAATPGFETFFGTSASAAHAAAIAGLMLSEDPSLSQADLGDALARTALDIEAPGVDRDSGAGIIDALAAMRRLRDAVAYDFDFDPTARSEILWRHDTDGRANVWVMDGFDKVAADEIGNPGAVWEIEGVGDFDGDLRSDILWRNSSTNSVSIWLMNGFDTVNSSPIGSVGLAWIVAGVADFNNDQRADILWRNTINGQTNVWLMDGFTKLAAATVGSPNLDWVIAGVGDFNDDRKSDVLWRNMSNGDNLIWEMDGLSKTDRGIANVSTVWAIEGAGDFTGDGTADILWRNASNWSINIWQMNNFAKTDAAAIGTVDPAVWDVARLGDYNGGGQADILWRSPASGRTSIWEMNGLVRGPAQQIGTVVGWTVK